MKIRNKRLTSVLISIFAIVFMAGSAFAFTAEGPLRFAGTSNVEANLELVIVRGYAEPTWDNITRARVPTTIEGSNHERNNPWTGSERSVEFETSFNRAGQASNFFFTVENMGTMPAVIESIDVVNTVLDGYRYDPDELVEVLNQYWHANRGHWSEIPNGTATPIVVQPGETVIISTTVQFLFRMSVAEIEALNLGPYLDATFRSELTLNYRMYLPRP